MLFGVYLKTLREAAGFSQDFISQQIEVSRPTYMQIEKDERELTVSEASKLSELFGLSLTDFLAQKSPKQHTSKAAKKTENDKEQDIRIHIPKFQEEKFKSVLLYVLDKVGAKPNIGETAIYKLLYFIDFDYYEKFEEHLTGASYTHNHFGPTPIEFAKLIAKMEKAGELERVRSSYFNYEQKKYLPRTGPNLQVLNAQELAHINEVLARLSDKSAKELSDYSHSDTPWKIHAQGEVLNYESVFYRDQEHSVRNYDDAL